MTWFRAGGRRMPFAALPAGVAIVVLAAGCSGSASSSTGATTPHSGATSGSQPTSDSPSTASPPAPAKAPSVGVCRRLDYASISHYSNADPSVSCHAPHTAYTFAVKRIPASVNVSGVSIGNKSIQDAASTACRNAFAGYIGGTPATRALSRLSVTYFLPEQRDFNRGAHWVRCDVVALKSFNDLAALPRPLRGALDKPATLRSYGVCSTGDPGAADSKLVMCASTHAYRALAALRVGSQHAPYPGKAVAAAGGQKRCSAYIADKLGTSGGYTYGWTYPTASDWASGQRFGYCWLKSTH